MSQYAILNFEDKIGSAAKGAADSTIKALQYRYEQRKAPTGLTKLFVGRNAVTDYRCVTEVPAIGFTTDAATLQTIRQACTTAKKIYLVLHGDPRTTDTAYTNAIGGVGVVALCTAQQLATFVAGLLPAKGGVKLALVMCYGARCKDYKNANVNHQGAMTIGNLSTSFAYRLVYHLAQANLSPELSAVTGKIQHDHTSGRALIEREELIDVNMDLAESMRQFTQDAQAAGGGEAWKQTAVGKAQFDGIKGLQAQRATIRSTLAGGDEANKYGKLVYRAKGTTLTIVNKYGGTGADAVSPGTLLYKGPLVAPGPA